MPQRKVAPQFPQKPSSGSGGTPPARGVDVRAGCVISSIDVEVNGVTGTERVYRREIKPLTPAGGDTTCLVADPAR